LTYYSSLQLLLEEDTGNQQFILQQKYDFNSLDPPLSLTYSPPLQLLLGEDTGNQQIISPTT
jgi:hypothetical protein